MEESKTRFDDGVAYEAFMGTWSRLAAEPFLRWLAAPPDLRWIDVGCGNGASTGRIVDLCAPRDVQAIDPSEEQLRYARTHCLHGHVAFRQADAMDLPFPNACFDAAVMALVIFFVPEPARGVAEMARVVAPGGFVSAYAWDFLGAGFPFAILLDEMAVLGRPAPPPPSVQASRMDALRTLWTDARLTDIRTREIEVERTFPDFDFYWRTALGGPPVKSQLAAMSSGDRDLLKSRLRARLPHDAMGRITHGARANAIVGRVR